MKVCNCGFLGSAFDTNLVLFPANNVTPWYLNCSEECIYLYEWVDNVDINVKVVL